MTVEKKILQNLGNSPNFCDPVVDIFAKKIVHGAEVQGIIKVQ
jgi:hypothetical protein